MYTFEGMQPFPVPTEMSEQQIADAIKGFEVAAVNARAAGFDAVEIHGASGYLPNQFLAPSANTRSDRWGGTIQNRARFMLEVIDAVASAIGADRVGLRLSPGFQFNDIADPDTESTYRYLGIQVASRGLAYLHVMSMNPAIDALSLLGSCYPGVKIANGGYDKARAEQVLASGRADFVSFGSLFVANPDLPERLARGLPLATPDPSTFYTPGPNGYTDYAQIT
jgi:N-ethylmaleimide reductase